MQVESFAECSKGSILQYFRPSLIYNLPSVIKVFVLPIFEWPLKTGFTVCMSEGQEDKLKASCFLNFFRVRGTSSIIWALTQKNLSSGLLIKGDSNQSQQLQRLARILKFRLK